VRPCGGPLSDGRKRVAPLTAPRAIPNLAPGYWRLKALDALSRSEWEALCDGCGKCCLIKLEDEDTGQIHFTDVACRLLDRTTARCTDYGHRSRRVPDCVKLSPTNLAALNFMPQSCAYRRVHEGRDLPDWHPLVTGDPESVHVSGMSVRQRVGCETEILDDQDYMARIVDWPNQD
jgi:uncharacterized cysteine cluster protein YcgN (CxxCxxCC family)